MKKAYQKSQSGFAHIVLIVLAGALFVGVGTLGVVKYYEAQDKKIASSQIETTQAKSDNTKTTTPDTPITDPAPSAPAATSDVATPAPAPASTPAPAPSGATTFAAAHCTGNITVFVSNQSGAAASYQPPSSWSTIKTHQFGQALSAYCMVGNSAFAPEYVLVEDAYVKSSDISPTKP